MVRVHLVVVGEQFVILESFEGFCVILDFHDFGHIVKWPDFPNFTLQSRFEPTN